MNQSSKYLLDTNIIIALFAGDQGVEARVRNTADVALAPPIIGELCFGHTDLEKLPRISIESTCSSNSICFSLAI